ncbi:chemosensory receptor A [Elysia marginata]|uniref:Chemosensory receptor A n=1 Tax=Elysia marginata TaxID=1093978 RepID=A0AAV4GF60_9GAST|nr:chemosensory receptor A [Elysia marginata]
MRVLAPLWVTTIPFGIASNITNIVVFLKTGAKDNVTILLLSLAISDLFFLILASPHRCVFIMRSIGLPYTRSVDLSIPYRLFYWPAFTAYDLSVFISVSLGLMRCACVAMPLKFKHVFTRSRTVKWVMFLVVLAVSLRLPVLTIHRLSWRIDPTTNKTVPYVKVVNRPTMLQINDLLNRISVLYLSYCILITCVGVLTYKLFQAAKTRRDCLQTSQTSDQQTLSSKDLKVVKSVVLVCSIFVLLQLPALVTSTTRLIVPEFNIGKDLVLLFAIMNQINFTCVYLNASINIFVYYSYNSKYRTVFRSLIGQSDK